MTAPIDELYFKWLYSQVGSVSNRNTSQTYWGLLRQLYQKEFIYYVPNDHNRAEDGRDLRLRFVHYSGVSPDSAWMDLGCSMLEMLIALSHRLSFEDGASPKQWFWKLIDNLEIEFEDRIYDESVEDIVDEVLDRVIWRTYEPDGLGGLFPIRHPREDQRDVEIWYQLCAYLLDE